MSLLPALIAMLAVMLAAAGASVLVRDGALVAAQHVDRQLARQRAEAALGRTAAVYGQAYADGTATDDESVMVEYVPSADRGEIADLPLQLLRVTAIGENGRSLVRLQADLAVDGCEDADEDSCMPRVRRIAVRELPVE